jgi:hypothetical protein
MTGLTAVDLARRLPVAGWGRPREAEALLEQLVAGGLARRDGERYELSAEGERRFGAALRAMAGEAEAAEVATVAACASVERHEIENSAGQSPGRGAGTDRDRAEPLAQPTPSLGERKRAKHKTCTHCGERKPLEDFPANQKMLDGRSSWCRVCHAEACARWRAEHPAAVERDRLRKRLIPAREKWQPCLWCGRVFEVVRRDIPRGCSKRCRERLERQALARELVAAGHARREVARVLGLHRSAVDRLLAHPNPPKRPLAGQR